MKILSANQIREADAFTIQHEPIESIDLMERAAIACTNWLEKKYDINTSFKIICGKGNNGGDGLTVARLLSERNYNVEVFIINYSPKQTPDFTTNYNRLRSIQKYNCSIEEINSIESFQTAFISGKQTIIIDALFGSGLNKPVEGLVAEIIRLINQSENTVISIDIPSGLYCDDVNNNTNEIIIANHTLSFQFPKLSFMFPETAAYIGEFSVLDIGLHPDYINLVPAHYYFVTKNDISPFLKKRNRNAHKGNFGHSLIIAGSYGKMGAAILSAKACLRTGTGLLTVHVPACGYQVIQTTVPEAMATIDSELNFITDNIRVEKYNAIGIGPGIGLEKQTQNALKLLIQNSHIPLVVDADAINIIAENKTWLSFVPPNSIFTPHLKEFERLAGKASTSIERLKILCEFSIKYNVYVVLKGSHTAIACPDGTIFFNSTGNPGMAKGGSGDTLTGIITALLAQQYSSQQACILGVYLHGLAGDFAAHKHSEESMIPSDLIECVGDAYNFLRE